MDLLDENDIMDGSATDAYFLRTEEALEQAETDPYVVAEVSADQYPDGEYEVFAGLNNALDLLKDLPVEVDALPEGSYFDGGPVMRIKGDYTDFARFETSLLGFLSHASGMATAADKVKRAIGDDTTVLSFGSRHVHPQLSVMLERVAMIVGFDGISHVAAANELGVKPSGTMPHALMLSMGKNKQEKAFKAFDNGVPDDVPRIALCDTYSDEVQEVQKAVDALGDNLSGVRLDTTSSRRGKFDEIIKEVRWTLKEIGREDVDIFVSGGITPEDIKKLDPLVDGFGIGGFVSNANPVDFGLDIVERNGEPISKRGKLSGQKHIIRTAADGDIAEKPEIVTDLPEGASDMLQPVIRENEIVRQPSIENAQSVIQKERDLLL